MTDSTPHVPFATLVKSPLESMAGPTPQSVPLIATVKEQREVLYAGRIYDFRPGQVVVDDHLLQALTAGRYRAFLSDGVNEMHIVKAFSVAVSVIAWYTPELVG